MPCSCRRKSPQGSPRGAGSDRCQDPGLRSRPNVETDSTPSSRGDNKLIGRAAGEYAVELLGGKGKAQGNIVEIWGGMGTQPAHDRHDASRVHRQEPASRTFSISNPATGSRTRPTTSWRRRCATTRKPISYTATTIDGLWRLSGGEDGRS